MAAVVRSERLRQLCAAGLRILAVALLYYAAGRIGLVKQVQVESAVVTPLWPATGVALSCLLYQGVRVWPGIAIGALLVVLTLNPLRPSSLPVVAGNTLAPVCAYLMLRQVGFRNELDRLRDGLALVFLGALGGMLISATVGPCVLLFTGKMPPADFWPVWTAWWAGDAMGVLVFTPLLLALTRIRMPQYWYRWAEAVALAVTALVIAPLVTRGSLDLLFLVFPLLIWAALRFQLPGSAPCAALVSVAATAAATDQVGPFKDHSLIHAMVKLQALNGSAALTALLLAAMVTEQRNVRRKIEQVCQELAEVVDHLAPEASARSRWPLPDANKRRNP